MKVTSCRQFLTILDFTLEHFVLKGRTLPILIRHVQATTCALDTAGKAYCWGHNSVGQLGDGSTVTSSSPVAVSTSGVLSGVVLTKINVGVSSACAVDGGGDQYCWGDGFGTTPVKLTKNTTAKILTPQVGRYRAYGLLDDGSVKMWSEGVASIPESYQGTAEYLLAGKTVISMVNLTDEGQGCALVQENSDIYCWGYNASGQLGNGHQLTSAMNLVPGLVDASGVLNGKTLTTLAAGNDFVCALDTNGKAYCWGYNNNGEVGSGSANQFELTSVAVDTSGVLAGKKILKLSAGLYNVCALTTDGGVYCWGGNYSGTVNPANVGNFEAVPVALNLPFVPCRSSYR